MPVLTTEERSPASPGPFKSGEDGRRRNCLCLASESKPTESTGHVCKPSRLCSNNPIYVLRRTTDIARGRLQFTVLVPRIIVEVIGVLVLLKRCRFLAMQYFHWDPIASSIGGVSQR